MSQPHSIAPPSALDDEHPTVEFGPHPANREESDRAGILKALGRPPSLLRVAVRPLWNDYFRVNVFTASNASGVAIPNSYFVTVDASGTILRSAPPLLRLD